MSESRSILLIEDSPTQAVLFSRVLTREGMTVTRVATSELAFDYLREHRPDLVIVDYHLPGMNGDQFCRTLRLSPGTESIPLLMLTDDHEAEAERHGLESGADDHVRKSADSDVLIARVQALLRKPRTTLPTSIEPFETRQILIVDDSPTYLAFLRLELTRDGHQVVTANTGEAAIELIQRQSFDCLVVDLIMPGINGIDLCRRLNGMRQASDWALPILMVTGQDTKDDMMRALEAGADDFVSKANDIVILKARIRALLRRKMLRDAHDRIVGEFRKKELEIIRERAAKEAAEARARLAAELERKNVELEAANREIKETQLQMVHAAKMVSLGELVAGIAHEVNNPLAYSMSHLSTASSALARVAAEVEGKLSAGGASRLAKASERIGDALGGLERVRDLVAKLRTFSRLDEGEFKWTDFSRDIQSTIALIGHRLSDRIALTADLAADNLIYCAPGLLNQAVMNLLSNSIDAVGERGDIGIVTRRSGNGYEISVVDSGPGVPAEIRERIFEPFFTTKDVGKGTGLGLSIVYRIVERHRGRIEVRTPDGGGTEFAIWIPADLEERQDAS